MARANTDELFTFRFLARFYRDARLIGSNGLGSGIDFSSIRHTVYGLEVRRAHRAGEPLLMSQIGEMGGVEVTMVARPADRPSRIVSYSIGDPVSLPVWLDAAKSSAALDGVLFRKATVLRVEDAVIPDPGA